MTIIATCHCGGTRIELPEAPTALTRCTCTYCTKTGGLWAYYPPAAPRVEEAHGAVYSPTTPLHEHHFCTRCGCTTHGLSPAYSLDDTEIPKEKIFAVNARLLEDYALLRSLPVTEIDGRTLW